MNLTKDELKRLDFEAVREMISTQEKRLKYLNGHMADELENEITELKNI